MWYRHALGGLLAVLLGFLSSNTARAGNLILIGQSDNTIGTYTFDGVTVNFSFFALSGSDLFITNRSEGTVGEYTTSGAPVNPALIMGLSSPVGIAVSGSDLFVVNSDSSTIGEYTTSGTPVNPALITGLNSPYGIAISGSDLFVTNFARNIAGLGTVGEYTTSGLPVNPALISGLHGPQGIAVSGWDLFVVQNAPVNTYTTYTGLITGLPGPDFQAIAPVPEPSTLSLLAISFTVLGGVAWWRRVRRGSRWFSPACGRF